MKNHSKKNPKKFKGKRNDRLNTEVKQKDKKISESDSNEAKTKKAKSLNNLMDTNTSELKSANNAEKRMGKRKTEDSAETSPSKKQKLHEMKFKERKLMRKQNDNDSFDIVKTLKSYWEDLRREDCQPDKKIKLLKQICSLLKGRTKEFAYAHDTVRVLECVMSEGSEEHRTFLFEELKDELVNLSKSKYGKFFVLKVLRYGTKKQKEAVMNAFHDIVTKLMKHTEAADVVETAFNECANANQRFQMVQEFYGSNYRFFKESNIHNFAELLEKKPEAKASIMSSMKEELLKALQKTVVKHSLIHHVLLQFFLNCDPASRSEIIESLREVVPEILHTKDGSRVAMHCVWYGNHRDRKVIIKHMKTFVKKIAMEEHGHMVLLALFDCVDDTTLIEKIIIKALENRLRDALIDWKQNWGYNSVISQELEENLLEVSQNVHGKKVLIYLLNPRDSHFFHPDVVNILKTGDSNEFSKKDPEKRRHELKIVIAEPLKQLIINNIAELYKNNAFCLFTVTILKHTVGERKEAFLAVAKLAAEPLTSENKNVHILENSGSFFMLKQLILNDSIKKAEGQDTDNTTFSEVLVNTVPPGVMKTWFHCNRGAFILVNLIETEIPAVVNKVSDEMTGCKSQLSKLNFKGAQILVEKLRKLPVNTNSK